MASDMTKPTLAHGAMPDLPEPGVSAGSYAGPVGEGASENLYTADQMREYARWAIQQAAGAVPEVEKQAVFEKWLRDVCPSGDVTAVQEQWLASSEYADWLEDQASPVQPDSGHLGAGGRGPLSDDFDLRGLLASKLMCWHRLTAAEVDNLLAFMRVQRPLTEDQAIRLVDEFAFEVGRSTVAVIEDLDKMDPAGIAIKQAFNLRYTALINALIAPRPDAPTSQINPGSAPREDGHG